MSYGLSLKNASFRIDRPKLESYLQKAQRSLEAAFVDDELWAYRFDKAGNVDDIEPNFEFLHGQILDSFEVIGPYVRKGSFIELEGEDGRIGRIDFDGRGYEVSGELFEDD